METKEGMIEYCNKICEINGWILNKDDLTFNDLIDGLYENKKNLGYQSCPCRLASGDKKLDRDLICPCDYTPHDIREYKACYCNLYLHPDFYNLGVDFIAVPERRPIENDDAVYESFSNK